MVANSGGQIVPGLDVERSAGLDCHFADMGSGPFVGLVAARVNFRYDSLYHVTGGEPAELFGSWEPKSWETVSVWPSPLVLSPSGGFDF